MKNPINQIVHTYNKCSNWGKILIFLVILLALVIFFNSLHEKYKLKEGFEESGNPLFYSGTALYDDFYVDIYDQLVYNKLKDDFEIGEVVNQTTPSSESIILDIGSGTGHHVGSLAEKGYKVTGIDISQAMVNKAKANYPSLNFLQGDINRATQFKHNSYTHILCMYFTIYYLKHKERFLQNCFNWLMPGGYLVIHLVDRNYFDPILPIANPLLIVSPQRYAKKRITKSNVVFDNFDYESNFKLDTNKNIAFFKEKFKFKNNKVRKQEHIFYMESEDEILTKAQTIGFLIHGKIDMMKVAYDYQYLYILTKPS